MERPSSMKAHLVLLAVGALVAVSGVVVTYPSTGGVIGATVITPRDAASGLPTGKRQ